LDDDDPFFLENKLVVFFHVVAALFSPLKFRVATGNLALNTYFRMWTLSGLRWWIFLSYQAWEGWLCLRRFWAHKLEHTN
jgi:hypothetical protein